MGLSADETHDAANVALMAWFSSVVVGLCQDFFINQSMVSLVAAVFERIVKPAVKLRSLKKALEPKRVTASSQFN